MEVVPGAMARTRRRARHDDWLFDGHFPRRPVVPAIVLIELVAQTGGLAVGAGDATPLSYALPRSASSSSPLVGAGGAAQDDRAGRRRHGGAASHRRDGHRGRRPVAAGEVTLARVTPGQP